MPGLAPAPHMKSANATTLVNSPAAQAIDELVRWEYKPQAKGEEWDPWGMEGGAPEVPGSWDDMHTAKTHKLIDHSLMLEVSRTRAAIRRAAEG